MGRTTSRTLKVRIVGEDKFSKSLDNVNASAKKTQASTAKLASTLSSFRWHLAAAAAAAFTLKRGMDEAAKQTRVVLSFRAQALSIDQARASTRGLIADYDLMLARSRATAFQLNLTDAAFAKLARGAAVMARRVGIEATDALNRLILGAGKAETELIDELGFKLDQNRAFADYAAQIGKTAKTLNDVERRAAITARVLSELDKRVGASKPPVKDLAGAWERLGAAMANASTKGADRLNTALFKQGGLLRVLLATVPRRRGAMTDLRDRFGETAGVTNEMAEAFRDARVQGLSKARALAIVSKMLIDARRQSEEFSKALWTKQFRATEDANEALKGQAFGLDRNAEKYRLAASSLDMFNRIQDKTALAAERAAKAQKQHTAALKGAQAVLNALRRGQVALGMPALGAVPDVAALGRRQMGAQLGGAFGAGRGIGRGALTGGQLSLGAGAQGFGFGAAQVGGIPGGFQLAAPTLGGAAGPLAAGAAGGPLAQAAQEVDNVNQRIARSFVTLAGQMAGAAGDAEASMIMITQAITQMLAEIAMARLSATAGPIVGAAIAIAGGLIAGGVASSRATGRRVDRDLRVARRAGMALSARAN